MTPSWTLSGPYLSDRLMPLLNLTDNLCRSAEPLSGQAQTDFYDTKVGNLALRVTSGGKKSWTWRYRWNGARKRLVLGTFGTEIGQLTLAQARKEARLHTATLLGGCDPGRDSRAAKERRTTRDENTVARAIERHIRNLRDQGKKESYLRDMRERFDLHVIPSIGDVPVRDVQQTDIEEILFQLADAGKRATHNRVLVMLRPIFAAENISPNPCGGIRKLAENREQKQSFSPAEVAAIWRALDHPDAGCSPVTAAAIRLAMLTLKRGGEVAGARISELDLDHGVWEIPGERMKNRRPETVLLTSLARDVVRSALAMSGRSKTTSSAEAVFFWADPLQPIQQNAMSRAFARAKRVAGLEEHGGTLHCLRHSGATFSARSGVAEHVISALLSHTAPTTGAAVTTARYQTYRYGPEKLAALEAWGKEIQGKLAKKKRPKRDASIRFRCGPIQRTKSTWSYFKAVGELLQ